MTRWLPVFLVMTACSCPPSPVLHVKDWSPEEQRQILAEEKRLSDDSILIPVLEDYARMRREAR
ncbi:hypothetical protein [Zavarzinella formosa]|uniref:hypothetical protein n=1 Tax=Zavarzinella formosa TaxID=360055 RepID=UPI00030EA2A0|nr:hypothetical protein [Zavarzinella formosa]